ncbi:uncharacterized protein KY384_000863 [Bacidia gigantensis]|uniref:uncharacterized protein n=1 Tax=Bacidia gigantensis TaxID=2732470 RepID=UPI001D04915F|nr:uncharacterized protein KY384_000863 [Bacidia gigantensis]KAG8534021.1 hypothetical protein KY384_000863 [Bacidia gigantensis]
MASTLVTTTVVGLLLALLWFLNPSYDPKEPRPISHTIPILGHAIAWAKDRRGFFIWGERRGNNKPYSMLLAGRKHYVFSNPADVATLFRKAKVMSIAPFIRILSVTLFGYTKSETTRLEGLHDSMHALYNKHLLNPEQYTLVVIAYFKDLQERMRHLSDEVRASEKGTLRVDAFQLLLDTLAKASTTAYFGRKPLDANPDMTTDMDTFVAKGFWLFLSGVPAMFVRNADKARKRIMAAMLTGVVDDATAQDRDDVSAFTRDQIALTKTVLSDKGVATQQFSFLFGLTSNSTPSTYLTLLHILYVPGLVDDLRAEMNASGFSAAPDSEKYKFVPHGLPLLRSCYFEAIRMHTVSASIREVLEETSITTKPAGPDQQPRTYTLKKGGVVNMPSSALHYNEKINPQPETFIPRRFVSKEDGGMGQNPQTSTRGFGGGSSYCPGRIFAERQIVGFVATLLQGFDVEVVDGEKWKFPKSAEFDDVSNSPRAMLSLKARDGRAM